MIAESIARRQAQHRCTLLRRRNSLVITFADCREREADQMFLAIKQTLYEMLFSEDVNAGAPALTNADHASRPQRRRQTAIGRLYRVLRHALVPKRGYRRLNKALRELRGAARQPGAPSHGGLALENASRGGWTHAAEPRAAAVERSGHRQRSAR